MSFKKIKNILEGNYDRQEYLLQNAIDGLHNSLGIIDTIIRDENLSDEESSDIVKRAKEVKEHLIQAISVGRPQMQEDGTVADLGALPKLPLSVVDARGQNYNLSGAGASKKTKSSRRRKKHECVVDDEEYRLYSKGKEVSDSYEDEEEAEEDENNFEREEHDKELQDYLKDKKNRNSAKK